MNNRAKINAMILIAKMLIALEDAVPATGFLELRKQAEGTFSDLNVGMPFLVEFADNWWREFADM
jgi:hypothetical protein